MLLFSALFEPTVNGGSILIACGFLSAFVMWRNDQRSALRDRAETLDKELKDVTGARKAADIEIARLRAVPSTETLAAAINNQSGAIQAQGEKWTEILERADEREERRDKRMQAVERSLDANTKALTVLVSRDHAGRSTDSF